MPHFVTLVVVSGEPSADSSLYGIWLRPNDQMLRVNCPGRDAWSLCEGIEREWRDTQFVPLLVYELVVGSKSGMDMVHLGEGRCTADGDDFWVGGGVC